MIVQDQYTTNVRLLLETRYALKVYLFSTE